METINSVASAAAKAVWGDNTQQQQHGDEPVSGKTGNTAKGEPYDAGNLGMADGHSFHRMFLQWWSVVTVY